MNIEKFKNNLSEALIKDSNIFKYILNRFIDDKYRGLHFSQHNRWKMIDIENILKILSTFDRMEILIGDEKNNVCPDDYKKFVQKVKEKNGKGSPNSIKKNLFPDIARMGLINRYDKNNLLLDEQGDNKPKNIKWVEISKKGISLISTPMMKEKYFVFAQGIEVLSQGYFYKIKDLFVNLFQGRWSGLTQEEFAIFVTGIDQVFCGIKYTYDDILQLTKDFLSLSKFQKISVINAIKEFCDENNSDRIPKQHKRDYRNFINESQQIIDLFSQTSIFEKNSSNTLYLKFGSNSMFESVEQVSRSLIEKLKYFEKHKVEKNNTHELHHIIPLKEAKTIDEFKLLDRYENMIYVDGNRHNEIHALNYYKPYKVSFVNNNLLLCSISNREKFVICNTKNKEIIFNPNHEKIIQKTNQELLTLL